jgi:hypothetical protein
VNEHIESKDALSIGLSVLFPTLIGIFGPLVGLILIAYIHGTITGGWLSATTAPPPIRRQVVGPII